MAQQARTRDRIEGLVEEEQRLLRQPPEGFGPDRHARLQAIAAELDSCWDSCAGARPASRGASPTPRCPSHPTELEGPEPEPPHLEHGVHGEGPAPEPEINPNAP
jgi:Protein of unknown function (DUF2630)